MNTSAQVVDLLISLMKETLLQDVDFNEKLARRLTGHHDTFEDMISHKVDVAVKELDVEDQVYEALKGFDVEKKIEEALEIGGLKDLITEEVKEQLENAEDQEVDADNVTGLDKYIREILENEVTISLELR